MLGNDAEIDNGIWIGIKNSVIRYGTDILSTFIKEFYLESVVVLGDDGCKNRDFAKIRFSAAIHRYRRQTGAVGNYGIAPVIIKGNLCLTSKPLFAQRGNPDLLDRRVHIHVKSESEQGGDVAEIERARIVLCYHHSGILSKTGLALRDEIHWVSVYKTGIGRNGVDRIKLLTLSNFSRKGTLFVIVGNVCERSCHGSGRAHNLYLVIVSPSEHVFGPGFFQIGF